MFTDSDPLTQSEMAVAVIEEDLQISEEMKNDAT